MPLVPHPPQSSRDAAADVAGARVGSGGARVGSGGARVGSGGSGGAAARVRAAGGDASSFAAAQQKAGLPALNFSKLRADYAAAGLEGALSSRAVAAGVSAGGGGGGGGGTARGRQYLVSGAGGYGSAITGAKPPLSKEPAAGNPGFARRVVPAGGGGTGAGGAALQPHPPSSDSHATGRLGSGGGKGAGAHAHKNPGPGANQDALPARQKQEITQPLTARAGNTKQWDAAADAGGAKAAQPMTARPASKGEAAKGMGPVKSTRYEDATKATPSGGSNVPLTPAAALKLYMQHMTLYEQGEILDYPQVYYVGVNAQKSRATADAADNHGYDDERGDYQWVNQDHISFRYQILGVLGKGSFGVVLKSFDWKTNQLVALKIIRNKKRFHHQALVEVKLLEHLRDSDVDGSAAIVTMYDYFYFRNHMCITFEMLCINLYEFIKNNKFQGLSLGLIRRIAVQLLLSLRFLSKLRVIHCDLKPENILLKAPNKSSIKVIDFGSSCFENERVYTYIQSRFYRSPEVILGLPYDMAIDMWSFGCILAELYTGYPIFPGENEVEQLACIMETRDLPPKSMVEAASRRKMFFDSTGAPRIVANSRGKKRRPGSKDIASAIRCNDASFVSFLEGCLMWDKRERLNPEQALQHEWITEAAIPSSNQYTRASPSYDAQRGPGGRTASGGTTGVSGSQSARGPGGSAAVPPKKAVDSKRAAAGYLTFRDRHLFPPIDPSTLGGGAGKHSAANRQNKATIGRLAGGL